MHQRGWTPELIPGLTPDDFAEVVSIAGWEQARSALGVCDNTLAGWMRGLGMPMPANQQKIRQFVSQTRYQQVLGTRRRRVRHQASSH